jgi:hypothetical protein
MGLVADVRECEQCGAVFAPRREHARFCSARCRMAWNREHAGAGAPAVALDWSITGMAEATGRLARARAWDLPRAVAAVSEAVWWVTLVDATLVRYHPGTYDQVLAGQASAQRQETEETLTGLRFVRNQMGHHLDPAGFIRAAPSRPGGDRGTAWVWNPLPEPALAPLSPRGLAWEMTRYRAYQARLAGRDVAGTFALTAAFLKRTAANAAAIAPAGQ